MIVTVGAQLTIYRIALFERLLPHLTAKYQEISQGRDCLNAVYVLVGKGAPEETVEHLPATKPARRWPARFMSARRKEAGARPGQWWDLISDESYSLSMGKRLNLRKSGTAALYCSLV